MKTPIYPQFQMLIAATALILLAGCGGGFAVNNIHGSSNNSLSSTSATDSTNATDSTTSNATTGALTVADTITCGGDVVNNSAKDATAALTACFKSGAKTIELVAGRYYIASMIDLGAQSNITIKTQNVSSGEACMMPGAAPCAILMATFANPGPTIFKSTGATNLQLKYVAFDGNIAARRSRYTNSQWTDKTAYNAKVHSCTSCSFIGFASVRAPQGTGMEFDGDNATFDHVLFRDNGWGTLQAPNDSAWADGLTIWSANNLTITNSTFLDNSDINLIIGNAKNSVISHNMIGNVNNYAFGALMLDNFNGGFPGDYTGTVIHDNTISCGQGMCGLGIDVGPKMWYNSAAVIGGKIYSNSIIGARQGILTYGATGTEIYNNQIGVIGIYTNGSCSTNFISSSSGDSVSIHDNSAVESASHLAGCSPQTLSTLLWAYPGVDSKVSKIYREVLGRDPDVSGGLNTTAILKSGTSEKTIRMSLAQSVEGITKLNDYYNRIFGRDIEQAAQISWTNALASGATIAQLYAQFQLTSEGIMKSNDFEARNETR